MRAVVVGRFGGPEVLELHELPAVALEPGAVRVRVEACGVNRADVLLRKGAYHGATAPARPGLEGAGTVVQVTAGSSYAPGDRVVLFADRSGLYCDEAVPQESAIARIPDGVTATQAAALPINWITAYACLHKLIEIGPQDTILIPAAASGVGTAAIQLAKAAGARVIACASTEAKLALARKLGADETFNYREDDVVEAVKARTSGAGVDCVIDIVGGAMFAAALKALAPFGRVAALANVTLEDSVINTRDFYPKNARIMGFQYGRLIAAGRYDPRPDLEAILDGIAIGAYQPVIDRTLPLSEAAEAHRLLESRQVLGKLVLIP